MEIAKKNRHEYKRSTDQNVWYQLKPTNLHKNNIKSLKVIKSRK